MENLSLIDVNKPEKLKSTLNELINYKNNAQEISEITAEKIGLGNVDNTKDIDKPLSRAQETYIDNENAKDVKLQSDVIQEIDSDIMLGKNNSAYIKRSNNTRQEVFNITNIDGQEYMNIGSVNVPLRLNHSKVDINNTVNSLNPSIRITDENGSIIDEHIAFVSDTTKKIDKSILINAETENGIVTAVNGNFISEAQVDEMGLHISVRNITNGELISKTIIPFKLASLISRGLMSKEDVATLNNLVAKVASMEGRTSRYIYTDSQNPTSDDIDAFARSYGNHVPYSGVAIVVDKTYHIWHYYENDDIGWRDDGSDTVTQATNTSFGTVIGSTINGKISIETDGSMSLVGYDSLISSITNLQNNSATKSDIQNAIGNVSAILGNTEDLEV